VFTWRALTGRRYIFLLQGCRIELLHGLDELRILLGEVFSCNSWNADGPRNATLVGSVPDAGVNGASQHFLEQILLFRL
jgi:hypothetical protein